MCFFAGLLLLLLLALFRCSSSASALPPSANNTSCSSSCDSIHNVSFPFGTSDSCGLPEFRLNCSHSPPLWWPPAFDSPLFRVVSIPSNQISGGTIVVQNTSNVSSCSALTHPNASSFPLSCPTSAFGLEFGLFGNIVLLINCRSVHNLKPNQSVADSFVFSTPHCMEFYSACNSSFGNQTTAPCFEMINERANLSTVKETYGCESNTSLYQIPTNQRSELAVQISWIITQSYYNCDSCKQSNGTCYRNSVNDSFFCHCPNGENYTTEYCPPSNTASPSSSPNNSNSGPTDVAACKHGIQCRTSVMISLGGSAIAVAILIVGAGFGIYCCCLSKTANQVKKLQLDSNTDLKLFLADQCGPIAQKTFTYDELLYATNSFSINKMLGDGGFGTVYEGTLYNGQKVAVKRLFAENARKLEQFLNEIRILSALIDHPNLVKLYGYCCEKQDDLLLVYEFVSNGTLAYNLHGDAGKGLLWETRLSIALETAQAIAYLHSSVPPILHRDVKSTNILLDENFHVKVADFGLSRVLPVTATHISTAPQGTAGYVDPEYHHCYQLNDKSDVYSFGVVLVELVSGKTPVDLSRDRMEINLSSLAVAKIQTGALDELIDPYLEVGRYSAVKEMVERVAELAFQCLALSKDDRPSMKEVVKVLMDIEKFRSGDGGRKNKPKSLVSRDSFDMDETSKLMETCRTRKSPTSVQEKWPSSATNSVASSTANGGKQPQTVMTSLNST